MIDRCRLIDVSHTAPLEPSPPARKNLITPNQKELLNVGIMKMRSGMHCCCPHHRNSGWRAAQPLPDFEFPGGAFFTPFVKDAVLRRVVRNQAKTRVRRSFKGTKSGTSFLCSRLVPATRNSYYLALCPSAASSCWSSSFCQVESGLYIFIALAKIAVCLPRSL